jgi:hypothetical protein
MKFAITPKLPGNLGQVPSIVDDVDYIDDLISIIEEELCNDNGELFGPGFELKISRLS